MARRIAVWSFLAVIVVAFIYLIILIKKQDRELQSANDRSATYQRNTDQKIIELDGKNRNLIIQNAALRDDFLRLNQFTKEELEIFRTTGQDMRSIAEWQSLKITEIANNFDNYKDRLNKIYSGAGYLVNIRAHLTQERETPMPGLGNIASEPMLAGFVIRGHDKDKNERAFVVTAAHLLEDIDVNRPFTCYLTVSYNFGTEKADAELYAYDRNYDVALLTFKNPAYVYKGNYAEFGKPDTVRPGNEVVALGSPNRDPYCVSMGVLAGKRQDSPAPRHLLLHTAGITFGNSGGPLLDSDGRVIGMNIQIQLTPLDHLGMRMAASPFSIALSANDIRFIMPELEHGSKN